MGATHATMVNVRKQRVVIYEEYGGGFELSTVAKEAFKLLKPATVSV